MKVSRIFILKTGIEKKLNLIYDLQNGTALIIKLILNMEWINETD